MSFFRRLFGLGPKVDLKELIHQNALILDVRTYDEYCEGCVKNSVNIPVNELPHRLKKLKDKKRPIITCCASGARSGMARRMLKARGYEQVYNGGSWQRVNALIQS